MTTYEYDAAGTRVLKKGKYGTVQYVSDNYTVRNKDLISKHVFAGNTRLVSKVILNEEKSGKMVATEQGSYYYHADHLGSNSVVTDGSGKFYEQIEYFPYGETWVHNKASTTQVSTPYKFTSKELDEETGLYYYGARYYDAKLSRWISADPPMSRGDYFPKPKDFDTEHDFMWDVTHNEDDKLPGMGGVFKPINLDAYHYAGQNPVKLTDPDGNTIIAIEFAPSWQYGSLLIVWNGVLPDGMYRAKTRADSNGATAAIKSGVYTYSISSHGPRNHFAKHKAMNVNNRNRVPTVEPNPKQGNKKFASGIKFHVGNKARDNNEGRSGSEGCITIPVVIGDKANYNPKDTSTWENYNNFIGNFNSGDKGTMIMIRPSEFVNTKPEIMPVYGFR